MNTTTLSLPRLSLSTINLVLLIEGIVSISIQLIVIRQLVPFVGQSIVTTSIVITAFLAALAIGYRFGGRRLGRERRLESHLRWLCVLIPLGLSYPIARLMFDGLLGAGVGPLSATVIYCLVCLVPIVYLLGEFVVMLVAFRQGGASQQAGETFYVSTIGNVVGGLFTTLVVMYFWGVGASIALMTVFVCVSLMLVTPRVVDPKNLVALLLSVASMTLNVQFETDRFLQTTAFANYSVAEGESADVRYLVVNGQNASRTSKTNVGHGYIEWFEEEIARRPEVRDILVLGAGGFTLGRGRFEEGYALTFVDVDDALLPVANQFLGDAVDESQFVVADARAHLLHTMKTYDAIVIDTFSHRISVPEHLVTQQFFQLVRSRLREGGHVLMNFIGSQDDVHAFSRGIDNTVRHVFGGCREHWIQAKDTTLYNRLYICRKSVLDDYRTIYDDNSVRGQIDSQF